MSVRIHLLCRFLIALIPLLAGLQPDSLVAAAPVTLVLHPETVASGGVVEIAGTGFAHGALIAIWCDFAVPSGSQRSTVTARSSDTGAFTADLPVPPVTRPKSYSVVASDFAGHRAASTLTVVPGVTLRVGIIPPVTPIVAGQAVYISGAGFAPDDAVTIQATFLLYSGGTAVVRRVVTAQADGEFSGPTLTVPVGTRAGLATIRAAGASGRLATATIRVQYHPTLAVHPSPIPRGSAFQINGQGFVPASRITLTLTASGTSRPVFSRVTTVGTAGKIQTTVPASRRMAAGRYTLAALAREGTLLARASAVVTAAPVISPETGSVSGGSRFAIRGYHFPALSAVRLTTVFHLRAGGTQTVTASTRVGAAGNFQVMVKAPFGALGRADVRAVSGPAVARTTVLVTPAPLRVTVAPGTAVTGESVAVSGTGYSPSSTVSVAVAFTLNDGTTFDAALQATSDTAGAWSTIVQVPDDAAPGTYNVSASTPGTGKSATTSLIVAAPAPSLLALPSVAAPGTSVTVNGFGFPPNAPVALLLSSVSVGSVSADSRGRFFDSIPVPATVSPGDSTLTARAGTTTASSRLNVAGALATHRYFPSLYTGTGYHESIALLNPTETDAAVTITYLRAGSRPLRLSFTVPAHTRVTRDVDADLGSRVSAAAVLTATQPVVAERLVRHGTDIAVDSGTPSPGSHWYFAAGNTSHGYREYLAVENPGTRAVQVSFLFMPAHGHPFTLIKSVGASSRLTVKVNLYVPNDAVAVQVSAPRPVAVNRTLFIRSGMSSKTGVAAPARSWYFASGPRRDHAVNWISVSNPGATPAVVTLRAYGVHGALLASVTRSIGPYLPVSFSMNRIAQHADVSVVVTSSVPVVAEQSTYLGPAHQATTAAFGMTVPTRAVQFAAMGARGSLGESDTLDVFNPSNSPAALVLRLITSSGTATQQTYLVGPRGREAIDVESVAGDTQLGASLVSSVPVVVVNRYSTDRGNGGDTSTGVQPPA